MLPVFLKGLAIGFSIAAPVGPIGILCIRRTLARGRLSGLLTGLGAATADAFYGTLAAAGLTSIAGLASGRPMLALRVCGGLFLLWLAWSTARPRPAGAAEPSATAGQPVRGLLGAYTSALALTMTNPMTILSFAAIFAGLGLNPAAGAGRAGAAALVAGVFAGSCLWWLILSGGSGLLRAALSTKSRWIDLGSGLVLAGFGLTALGSALVSP